MNTATQYNKIEELIVSLEKAAPRSCSKPKSEMCNRCIDRVYSDRAVQIQDYLAKLKNLKIKGSALPSVLENSIREILNST